MVEIVCEFVVKEAARGRFELAYGPGGVWSNLCARFPGFWGITVLRDTKNPRRYLTIEIWETEVQREQALIERKAEYSDLQAALGEWIESRTPVGSFSVLAGATVRPLGRTARSGAGDGRRTGC